MMGNARSHDLNRRAMAYYLSTPQDSEVGHRVLK